MGKGKLFISKQQNSQNSQEPQPVVQNQGKNKTVQAKKIKKKKKNSHHQPKTNILAPIEMLGLPIDEQNQQEMPQEQNRSSGMLNKRVFLEQENNPPIEHIAICFPDSILQIPQTSALRAYFISQVARISSIFKIDEIVILRDHGYISKSQNFHPAEYIARNLQYLETPQYLRKHLFKMHADLQNAGLMNPIQCHHHLKTPDICQFRQGVTVDRPTKKNAGSWVDIGLKKQAQMDVLVPAGTRVTLRLKDYENQDLSYYQAQAVSNRTPRQQQDLYWGYTVRIANNIKQMISPKAPQVLNYPYTTKILCNANKSIKELQTLKPSDQNFKNALLDNMPQGEGQSILLFFSGTDDLRTLIGKDSQNRLTADQVIEMFDYSLQFDGYGVQKLRVEQQMWMGLGALSGIRK